VLDLRRNGGGSLTEAINLTGLFIDVGPVVQVKGPNGRVQHYDDMDRGMAWEGPLVVVTSKFSASASEILAGAVQDYGRGLIVGDKSTHGKGTVQSLLDLGAQIFQIPDPPKLGALKLTMQQFYRPNGDSTQKRGVLADIELPSMSTHLDVGEADLDYAIEFDRVKAARYMKYNMVDADMVARLSKLSAERRRQSGEFAELRQKIDRYLELKARKTSPLNEKEFFAQREKLDAEEEEEKQLEEQNGEPDDAIERDFYVEEVLAITRDYVSLLNRAKIARTN
jgi:carboxyl-terminal processing protease